MAKLLFLFMLLPTLLSSQNIMDEELNLKNGDIKIPGTLSYPKSDKKIPLVIFVPGSGNVDRNGNQAGTIVKANYIKTLADSLNAKGIAFYRYDKRTATEFNMDKLNDITLNDFVEDVKVAINHFKDDGRFSSIHLIGHSQGSLVGMLSVTDAVKSYISIAGPGQTIDKTLIDQLNKQSPEMAKIAQEHIDELMSTDTIVKVNPFLMQLFAPQNQKFLANWIRIDPIEEIKTISIPILIINGGADLQVQVADAERLKEAKPNAQLKIIPKMNHVLKEVTSIEENRKSYQDAEVPLSSELVKTLVNFIKSNS